MPVRIVWGRSVAEPLLEHTSTTTPQIYTEVRGGHQRHDAASKEEDAGGASVS